MYHSCDLRTHIERYLSMGAHVLLSNEPMVVLDTAKVSS